jgi:hypothetical protein
MAGVQFRRQDNMQKPPRFRCSIVCESILRQATLSCPQHVHFSTHPLGHVGACPVVCGAGDVRRFGPRSFAPSCRGAARLSRIAE